MSAGLTSPICVAGGDRCGESEPRTLGPIVTTRGEWTLKGVGPHYLTRLDSTVTEIARTTTIELRHTHGSPVSDRDEWRSTCMQNQGTGWW